MHLQSSERGLDFSFEVASKPTGETAMGNQVLVSAGEVNHFHPDYRKPGETWTMPKLELQYRAFQAAKKAIEENGGLIFNASRKTALDVFPRVDFDQVVKNRDC